MNDRDRGSRTSIALLGMVAAVLLACGDDGDAGEADVGQDSDDSDSAVDVVDEGSGNTGPEPGTACSESADCAGGQTCVDGVCREACSADDPCRGALPACTEEGFCAACATSEDCGEAEFCASGTLVCIAGECVEDRECAGGFACEDATCVPLVTEGRCEPGVGRCPSASTLEVCRPDGRVYARQACEEGTVCTPDGDTASCAAETCPPTGVGCVDDATAYYCENNTRVELPCRESQRCEEGACVRQ